MSNFLFIDVDTQKCFVEHFGELAIDHCSDIRENLMDVTHLARVKKIPIAAFVYTQVQDKSKVADTQIFDGEQNLFEHDDFKNVVSQKFWDYFEKVDPRSVFVYGVPLESSVSVVCKELIGKVDRVWLVTDAVKSYDNEKESSIIDELKELGVKVLTSRNLESLINM